jgi:RsiW-degrading membrane proteinase PrsW (M82 family)
MVDNKSVKEAAKDLSLKSFPRPWTCIIISLCIVGVVLIFLLLACLLVISGKEFGGQKESGTLSQAFSSEQVRFIRQQP